MVDFPEEKGDAAFLSVDSAMLCESVYEIKNFEITHHARKYPSNLDVLPAL